MHHHFKSALSLVSTLVLFTFTKTASADAVTDWNLITVKATKVAKFNSNLGSRIEAIESIAVYDAVNSINQIGTPYHFYAPPTGPASLQAAVAQAAHDVLVNYFPIQKTLFGFRVNQQPGFSE